MLFSCFVICKCYIFGFFLGQLVEISSHCNSDEKCEFFKEISSYCNSDEKCEFINLLVLSAHWFCIVTNNSKTYSTSDHVFVMNIYSTFAKVNFLYCLWQRIPSAFKRTPITTLKSRIHSWKILHINLHNVKLWTHKAGYERLQRWKVLLILKLRFKFLKVCTPTFKDHIREINKCCNAAICIKDLYYFFII